MRKSRARWRQCILFCIVIISIFLIWSFLCRHADGMVESMGQNLSIKFYNGVLNLYAPAFIESQKEGVPGMYRDVTASIYPAIAYNEEVLWYESQAEGVLACENLAAQENEQAKQILTENQQAKDNEKTTYADSEKKQENVLQTAKVDETGKKNKKKKGKDKGKKEKINRKKLQDFDYLCQTFYQVDNTTTINRDQLNVDALLSENMKIDTSGDGPQILIYHTHSQEGYKDSKAGDAKTSVIGVGDRLTELLEEKGFKVLHHKGKYDVGKRDRAYSVAASNLQKILEENPSIQVVIDLHRDGVAESTHLVTEQNGKKMAQIMFFNGLSRTTATGDIAYLKNPYIADNLAFSFQMQLAAAEYYPDFTRRIYLKGYRYNMHFCPKSLLVEVGAQTNTYEEAENAMEPLADILAKVLKSDG